MTAYANREERKAADGSGSTSSRVEQQRMMGGYDELMEEEMERQKQIARLHNG